MKWFTYSQNNSGGYFIDNDDVSHLICIEAENADQANSRALEITEDYGEYCTCCGERWYCSEWEEDGASEPSQYKVALSKSEPSSYRITAVLHFANGNKRKVKIGEPIDLS